MLKKAVIAGATVAAAILISPGVAGAAEISAAVPTQEVPGGEAVSGLVGSGEEAVAAVQEKSTAVAESASSAADSAQVPQAPEDVPGLADKVVAALGKLIG